MKTIVALSFFTFLSLNLSAQSILSQNWLTQSRHSDVDISVGGRTAMYGLTSGKSDVNPKYFWEEEFQKSSVYFYQQQYSVPGGEAVQLDSLLGVEVRFDLWNNNVEFKVGDEIKIIETNKVSNILSLNDEEEVAQFINPREFDSKNVKGFFELLGAKDHIAFLKSKEITVQRGDYNAALDIGSKDPIITQKEHFHFWDGKAKTLVLIDSKKEVMALVSSLGIDGKHYLKNSKNKLKEDEDYKKLAHFVFETSR